MKEDPNPGEDLELNFGGEENDDEEGVDDKENESGSERSDGRDKI